MALNPHTPAEMIENVLDLVDHVLVMTVNPGFGGQKYIPTMTSKVRKIRKWIVDRGLDVDIEVDGGIKATKETIGECARAGANCFIAGSGLFAFEDMSEGVKKLKRGKVWLSHVRFVNIINRTCKRCVRVVAPGIVCIREVRKYRVSRDKNTICILKNFWEASGNSKRREI